MSSIFVRENDDAPYSGPFTERELQQQYREGSISPTAFICFTAGRWYPPDDAASSYSLLDLRNRCGIGCPFMDPSKLPKRMGRSPTSEETKLKGLQFSLAGIRASCKELASLEKYVDSMLEHIERMENDKSSQAKKKRKNKKKKTTSVSISSDEVVSDRLEPSREDRLQRLTEDAAALRSSLFSALSLKKQVEETFVVFKQQMTSIMRENMESLGNATVTCDEKEDVKGNVVVEMMNTIVVQGVSIEDLDKAPEKPIACSRTNWLGHLKMAKRFANAIHEMFTAMNTGSSRDLDAQSVTATMKSTNEWQSKWEKTLTSCPQLQQLIDHEIVNRLKEIPYFFCYLCMLVHFDPRQALAHVCKGEHSDKINEMDQDSFRDVTITLATSSLQIMTKTPQTIADAHTTEFSLPLLKSGMRVPVAKRDSLPSRGFVTRMKEKYAAIQGEIDKQRLNDPVYVASVVQGIVSRHKSEVGRQLFAELDNYFRNGMNFYCEQCGWMLTSRGRYYRHLKNIAHIGLVTNRKSAATMSFDLVTFSINIHAVEEE